MQMLDALCSSIISLTLFPSHKIGIFFLFPPDARGERKGESVVHSVL